MIYRKWKVGRYPEGQVKQLSGDLGVGSLLAKVLISKQVTDRLSAREKFLVDAPLSDPFLMKDMDKAVERIWKAVRNEEKIVVYGDYDVDGVCATATLFSYLENIGARVYYKLPNRESEGYGLNSDVLTKLKEKGVDLVITVDNGIAAIEQVDHANAIGLDVVITDHHIPKDRLPAACAVVDPLRADDNSPCKVLAGVGVAFKLVCAMEEADCADLADFYADYVAVGTIADLMLMEGENRTLVKVGLDMLNNEPRTGFAALMKVSGLDNRQVTSENVSYTIAPRINAAGRIKDATEALELLLCDDEEQAREMADALEAENRERQEIQNRIAEGIAAELQDNDRILKDRIIVVWGEDYHPGVIGIVASRLVERYSKPAIVFTRDGDDFKGSGRSVKGFNLHKALDETSEYLLGFGGHELAAGMTIAEEKLESFRKRINELARNDVNLLRTADLDAGCLVSLSEINTQNVSQIDVLQPFGNGNPSPSFVATGLQLTAVIPVSGGKHVRIKVSDGAYSLAGIMFNTSPAEIAFAPGDMVDICFTASIYSSDAGDMVSARIREIRPAGMSDSIVDSYDTYNRFKNGFLLTRDEKRQLRPDRNDVAAIYRAIMQGRVHADDLRPLFIAFPDMPSGKIRVIIDVLLDLGLIEVRRSDYINSFAPVRVEGKKDLMSSKILLSLQ
ncbi:MAG: single-stranded-DNA-specific exonuclease RecJ [Oscillospiraceae bacterium]|nr:single-stranded-DNA-specific exonuclease RecJ [Oscillospiraceae bacterium]